MHPRPVSAAHYIGSVLKLVDKKEVLFTISEALPRIDGERRADAHPGAAARGSR